MTVKKMPNEYDEIKGFLNKIRKIQELEKERPYGVIKEQIEDNELEKNRQDAPDSEGLNGQWEYNNQSGQLKRTDDDSFDVKDPTIKSVPGEEEKEDIAVINDVEVEIHSEDPEDLALQDIEKQTISQLIDDFRKEVSEIAEFDKLHIYPDSAKLDGRLTDYDITFMLSTGNDKGLYISNPSMIKIDDDTIEIVSKLRTFEPKFINSINDLLVSRRST